MDVTYGWSCGAAIYVMEALKREEGLKLTEGELTFCAHCFRMPSGTGMGRMLMRPRLMLRNATNLKNVSIL